MHLESLARITAFVSQVAHQHHFGEVQLPLLRRRNCSLIVEVQHVHQVPAGDRGGKLNSSRLRQRHGFQNGHVEERALESDRRFLMAIRVWASALWASAAFKMAPATDGVIMIDANYKDTE
jgi:hypothetical protein